MRVTFVTLVDTDFISLPDIIPNPSANFSSLQPLFSTPSERGTVRQPLELLDNDIVKNQGKSALTHRALRDLKPYLDPSAVTEL